MSVSHVTILWRYNNITLENILKYTIIKSYKCVKSHIMSHIHIKQK